MPPADAACPPEQSCPTCAAPPPPPLSVDQARAALASCVLSSSYTYCVAGVLLSVPLGVRYKTYTPLAYAGLAGTAADLLHGYSACSEQRERLAFATKRLEEEKRAP